MTQDAQVGHASWATRQRTQGLASAEYLERGLAVFGVKAGPHTPKRLPEAAEFKRAHAIQKAS